LQDISEERERAIKTTIINRLPVKKHCNYNIMYMYDIEIEVRMLYYYDRIKTVKRLI